MPVVKALLTKLRCLTETDEVGSDEPYVLVFAAQMKNIAGMVNVAAASTTIYGPWEGVDKGDLVETGMKIGGKQILEPKLFWGLNGKPQHLDSLNDVIFIAALMENDDAAPEGIRVGLHAQLFAAITSYANAGMARAEMVNKLKRDMTDVLKGITVTGLPNNDDLVGVTEVQFGNNALKEIQNGTVVKTIELAGDGGKYRLRFELSKG